jgi:four helix bundle protein
MAAIQSFRDLKIYQLSREQAKALFQIARRFPKEETYSLTDQIRRSSRAVSAIVAEGWGRRRYEAAFINKMNEALSEAMETQAWLDHALDCGYINEQVYRDQDSQWQRIGGMINRTIERSADFCNPPTKSK